MRKYYLHNGTAQTGPFTIEELKTQKISKKTPVWYEGITDWTPAKKIPELLDLITIQPPSFKTVTSHTTPSEINHFIPLSAK
jgi:hypothetical protein